MSALLYFLGGMFFLARLVLAAASPERLMQAVILFIAGAGLCGMALLLDRGER